MAPPVSIPVKVLILVPVPRDGPVPIAKFGSPMNVLIICASTVELAKEPESTITLAFAPWDSTGNIAKWKPPLVPTNRAKTALIA